MRGYRFGENNYTILSKCGEGFEGSVWAVFSQDKVMAAKITPLSDETVRMCPSWGHKDFDLRRTVPFKNAKCIDWKYADEGLQAELMQYLKLLKEQHKIHSQLKGLDTPCLLPPLEDRGMVLVHSPESFVPAVFEIYPLIQGKTVKKLLESIESAHLTQSFLNTSRVRSGLDITDTYSRLADIIVNNLTEGIESLHNAGYTLTDIDFHPSNLMYGRIDDGENRIFLIDQRLTRKKSGCDKDELLAEIHLLGEQVRNWQSHSVLLNAYYDGFIEEMPV